MWFDVMVVAKASRKHEAFTRCCFNVGPPLRRWPNIETASGVCWAEVFFAMRFCWLRGCFTCSQPRHLTWVYQRAPWCAPASEDVAQRVFWSIALGKAHHEMRCRLLLSDIKQKHTELVTAHMIYFTCQHQQVFRQIIASEDVFPWYSLWS